MCVFMDVVIKGKCDELFGFKENVIIGKLVLVGIGMMRYCNVELIKN